MSLQPPWRRTTSTNPMDYMMIPQADQLRYAAML